MIKKKQGKIDEISCTILAAFILMSAAHFNCRYNIGPLIDTFFREVSAERLMVNASTPLPLAADPVVVPDYGNNTAMTSANTLTRSIARNPFAVPAAVRAIPVSRLPAATTNNTGAVDGMKNSVAVKSSPILRGIVHSGDKSMAIIEYQGVSKAYNVGQNVGSYTLENIGDASVAINGEVLSIGGNG
ncbi:MAG: hypothetical protein WC127_05210 [Acidaminococcaceae bacterium]|nr:hypothetical protein [Acidaminococcaceae bacterium]